MEKVKNGFKNIIFEIIYFIVNIVINLIVRKQIIKYMGVEVVALNHILNQIVNFMALIEFGIYNIVVFNLYSALKEDDKDKINDIMNIFKKIYTYVTVIIIVIGICFIPFIKYFINDYNFSFNYIIIYLLVLIQIACTYLFSYKTYLLQADQKSYLYLIIMILFKIISSIIEILLLIRFKNYYIYFTIYVVDNLLMYYTISKYVDKKYSYLNKKRVYIDTYYSENIKKHIRSTAVSKICGTLKQSLDTFLLGLLSNVSVLGLYSNYYVLLHSIYWVIQKLYDSFRAIIGNIVANENEEKIYKVFYDMSISSYIIGVVCSIIFYIFVDFVIVIWIGKQYLLPNNIVTAFSFQLFFVIFRISLWQFIAIKGWFDISKISDLIGLITNFVSSILLYFKFGMLGVIIGTIISELVQYIIELYMILNKFNKVNISLIFKQVVLIILYIFIMFMIKMNYLLFMLVIIIIIFYVIHCLKRSKDYVFKSKKTN